MAIIGSVLKTLIPAYNLVPKGTGAKVGQAISNVANKYLPQTYNQNKPVTQALFGGSVSYAKPVSASESTLKSSTSSLYRPYTAPPGTVYGPPAPSNLSGGGSNGGSTGGGSSQQTSNFSYDNAPMIPTPDSPSIDFDALIRPALEGLDASIAPLEQGYAADVQGINERKGTQIATANQQFGEQSATLGRQRTGQIEQGENAVNEQRRGLSEINQGLQARYGGSTGTGAFASEFAGGQALRNIGNIRQTLSQNLAAIDDKLVQVKELGRIAVQDIEDKATDQIRQAKSQLDMSLAEIRRQKGELQSRKAELAANALQLYQQTVNQVQASNAQFKQQLYVQQLNAENQLKAALQKGSSAIQSLSLGNLYDPATKLNQVVTYNKQGQINPVQGYEGKVFYSGAPPKDDNELDSLINQVAGT